MDATTIKLLPLYQDKAEPLMFLTGWCQSPPQNYFNAEKVGVDILRDDQDIAVPVKSMKSGPRLLEDTKYINVEVEPPVIMEAGNINAWNAIKRQPGQEPTRDPEYAAVLTEEAFKVLRRVEKRARRTIELMTAQVMQGGAISLVDSAGTVQFSHDYGADATHKVTVGTTWATDGATGDPLGDIEALGDVVRQDGLLDPDVLIFGSSARQRFLKNADVRAQLDNRRMEIGAVRPEKRGNGATYFGTFSLGGYNFECWEYKAMYKHPSTGTLTRYVGTDNVIMLSNQSRIDLVFGGYPELPGAYEDRAMQYLPSRLSDPATGLDLNIVAYFTENRRNLIVEGDCRPLVIPTAIDTIAYLDCTH